MENEAFFLDLDMIDIFETIRLVKLKITDKKTKINYLLLYEYITLFYRVLMAKACRLKSFGSFPDPPPAQHLVAVVKYSCLTRCNSGLRCFEADAGRMIIKRCQ